MIRSFPSKFAIAAPAFSRLAECEPRVGEYATSVESGLDAFIYLVKHPLQQADQLRMLA